MIEIRKLLPFFSEISNLLTMSGVGDFYKHYPVSFSDNLMKNVIDMVSLFGIIWNISHYSIEHTLHSGLIKSASLLVIGWLIPRIFMHDMMRVLCKNKCGSLLTMLIGLLIISMLLYIEDKVFNYFNNEYLREKGGEQKK